MADLPNAATPGASTSSKPKPRCVYLIDDDPLVLSFLRDLLTSEGYQIETFLNPPQALELFHQSQTRPSVVITGHHLTPMNGLELIERFRRICPLLKFVLLSPGPQEKLQEYPFKIHAFLKKPVRASRVLAALDSLF